MYTGARACTSGITYVCRGPSAEISWAASKALRSGFLLLVQTGMERLLRSGIMLAVYAGLFGWQHWSLASTRKAHIVILRILGCQVPTPPAICLLTVL